MRIEVSTDHAALIPAQRGIGEIGADQLQRLEFLGGAVDAALQLDGAEAVPGAELAGARGDGLRRVLAANAGLRIAVAIEDIGAKLDSVARLAAE
jgi:hypothetical protein